MALNSSGFKKKSRLRNGRSTVSYYFYSVSTCAKKMTFHHFRAGHSDHGQNQPAATRGDGFFAVAPAHQARSVQATAAT
jgi:hypothetical protein